LSTVPAPASVQSLLTDGTSSEWLKSALETALQRDPVDALNDALLLAGVLEERLRLLFDLDGLEETPREEDRV
jgi:hypothetical protein